MSGLLQTQRLSATLSRTISNIIIFGGGLMGSGIAQVAAQTGHNVLLVDQDQDILSKSQKRISDSLVRVAKKSSEQNPDKFVKDIMGKISTKTFNNESNFAVAENTDLIIEAIVENMDAKHKLFSILDASAPKSTLFASNTSSLSIDKIFSVTSRRDKVGGLHFFNPVPMMKLLEIVKGEETSQDTLDKLTGFGKAMKKSVVICKDTPGFIVNRLLVPYMAEAARLAERGDASIEDIDTAMKLGAGYPMGPFELMDYVGLDTAQFILDGWQKDFPDEPAFKCPAGVKKLVSEGKLGKKSGQGFYSYAKL